MAPEPVLFAREWRQAINPSGTLPAVDPRTKETLLAAYPVSGSEDVVVALTARGHRLIDKILYVVL